MEGYACKVPELKCVENKDSDTALDECIKYCKPSKLPKGVTTNFAYSPFMYFFNSAIKYESKLQYPFPKEYGYILEDPEYIELPTGINEHAVNKLRTEFHDIYKNKSYVLSNILIIMAKYTYRGLYVLDNIYVKDVRYSDIYINKIVTTDWKDEHKTFIVDPKNYEPGGMYDDRINGELEDILYTREHTYEISSVFSFLKNLRNALDSEEISVFGVSIAGVRYDHANAIIVHPKLNNIYYIEPYGGEKADTHFTNKLKIITDNHGRWNWRFNYQIQANDPFCVSWVGICVAMIIANPYKDGIELISLLMLDEYKAYSLRYTILVLWLYYVREKLTQGTRAIKHYVDPNYKHMVMGEYRSQYSSILTDEEVERKYNYDMPLLKEILEILNKDSLEGPNAAFNIDNINTRFTPRLGCILL